MKVRAETVGAGLLLLVSVAYVLYSLRYPLGTLVAPGPGVFPLVIGIVAIALSAYEMWEGKIAWEDCARRGLPVSEGPPSYCVDTYDERRPTLLILALVVYLAALETVGFLTCTALLVVVSSRLMGARGWRQPVILALATCLACYLVFVLWLRLTLPTGFLI